MVGKASRRPHAVRRMVDGGMRGLLAGLLLTGGAAGARAADWTTVPAGSSGRPQVIGTYTAGCVAGAQKLPTEGPGYEAVRLSRNRHWGHPAAIAFTRQLALQYQALGLPHVWVGDISQPRGGPAFPLHASHQAGLDVDIWFEISKRPPMSVAQRESPPVRSLVMAGETGIDDSVFRPEHVSLLRTAAEQPQVDRIFVNKWIKRRLCQSVTGPRSWMRKVTPWFGHDEHFHIRLSCPADSPLCQAQAPMPASDGCNDSLDWWFRPAPPQDPNPRPPARPRLPAQCDQVLNGP